MDTEIRIVGIKNSPPLDKNDPFLMELGAEIKRLKRLIKSMMVKKIKKKLR